LPALGNHRADSRGAARFSRRAVRVLGAALLGDHDEGVDVAELHRGQPAARAMEASSRAAASSASRAAWYAANAPGRSSRRAARYSAQRSQTSSSAMIHASTGSTLLGTSDVERLVANMAATVVPNRALRITSGDSLTGSHHRHRLSTQTGSSARTERATAVGARVDQGDSRSASARLSWGRSWATAVAR